MSCPGPGVCLPQVGICTAWGFNSQEGSPQIPKPGRPMRPRPAELPSAGRKPCLAPVHRPGVMTVSAILPLFSIEAPPLGTMNG